MIAPFTSANDLDRLITALEGEVADIRGKRDRLVRSLAERQQKLERLKSQRLLMAPGAALEPALCIG